MPKRMSNAEKDALPQLAWDDDLLERDEDVTPEYRGGRKVNQYKVAEAAKQEGPGGRTDRTDTFARNLLALSDSVGGKVPYAFKLSDGEPYSLDWGCVGFLYNSSPSELRLHTDRYGYVEYVEPTEALRNRYGATEGSRETRPSRPAIEVAEDIAAIAARSVPATQIETLVLARLGQGAFRSRLLQIWGGRCAVTACPVTEMLRASHIRPWRDGSDEQRLDPANGLLLVANLDALFDCGLISFTDNGEMLVAKEIEGRLSGEPGLGAALRAKPTEPMRRYLGHHRTHIFRGS